MAKKVMSNFKRQSGLEALPSSIFEACRHDDPHLASAQLQFALCQNDELYHNVNSVTPYISLPCQNVVSEHSSHTFIAPECWTITIWGPKVTSALFSSWLCQGHGDAHKQPLKICLPHCGLATTRRRTSPSHVHAALLYFQLVPMASSF